MNGSIRRINYTISVPCYWILLEYAQIGIGDRDPNSNTYIIIISVIYFFAGDIKQVIKALNYSSCILVAHDWGGAVAWTFATEYPELVDKLICMNMPNPRCMQKHLASSLKQIMKSWYDCARILTIY